jgi:CelD/BcsL family acetyltransferase involved in cellulose biosynthesis
MAWNLIDFAALDAAELGKWQQVRAADPTLDSPFFNPGFTGAVHALFDNVQIAINNEHQVWFPLQVSNGVARPAGPGADFQGPIAAPGVCVDPFDLVRSTGLRALRFDHLFDRRAEFSPWVENRQRSPLIDATGGLDGYLTRVSKGGREKMSRVRGKTNRAGRELGDVRLVWDADEPDLLDRLIQIKRVQYETTGGYDFFATPRHRELVHQLLKTRVDGFAGVLSAVYAGDTLLAAHFGLRDRGVLHWWFPVFNRAHGDLAPGWILLRELIGAAPDNGVTRIDLGRGEEDYKLRAMTGSVPVCEGDVTPDMWRRRLWQAQRAAVGRLKSSTLGPRLRVARNRARRVRDAGR